MVVVSARSSVGETSPPDFKLLLWHPGAPELGFRLPKAADIGGRAPGRLGGEGHRLTAHDAKFDFYAPILGLSFLTVF